MSRSGYSDSCEYLELYRHAVTLAIGGARGQHFLRKLRAALDALPTKRLITDQLRDSSGDVCAFGAIDATGDDYEAEDLARRYGIARALAAEVVFENDEANYFRAETPEQRWVRMRSWVERQIRPEFDEA